MMHAYDRIYLERAQETLGGMLDYAVNGWGEELASFFELFLICGLADRFAHGEANLLVGRSGAELAGDVWYLTYGEVRRLEPYCQFERSPEYWTGWALAFFQWHEALSFQSIEQSVAISEIREMYHPYHEADVLKFVEEMQRICRARRAETRLAGACAQLPD